MKEGLPTHFSSLIQPLEKIRTFMLESEKRYAKWIDTAHPRNKAGAKNLVHYLAFRAFHLRRLQDELSAIGLSSFGHSERYVLRNVENILYWLYQGTGNSSSWNYSPFNTDFFESREQLEAHTRRLFGPSTKPAGPRIMVTMPSEAAEKPELIHDLLKAGMDIARINCSHDDEEVWQKMIEHIETQRAALGVSCYILMDLPGPKIRTGNIKLYGKRKHKDYLLLFKGDSLLVYKSEKTGRKAKVDHEGAIVRPATIGITLPEVLEQVEAGHRIAFDDGKLEGIFKMEHADAWELTIMRAPENGFKLKPEKGVNLPDTPIALPSLTAEDLAYLPFIAAHADLIAYSFVRSPEDVSTLQHALEDLGRSENMGLVLKIENKAAFDHLPEILLAAMRSPKVGVMTARGDLSVELGFERVAEVQEELLWMCEAAHLPDIWATQVLETSAKTGLATRSEITDAAMSVRAECVMLNKGPYIVQTVRTLSNILARMAQHQNKKMTAHRHLNVALRFLGLDHPLEWNSDISL